MPIAITTSSPKAAELAAESTAGRGSIYPFAELENGQSFTIPMAECNWRSVRVMVSQNNAKFKNERRFLFVKHDDLELVEVARIK